MKYIANASGTHDLLQHWAGDSELICAKYFFWNAGASMQKSQQGLLQSLLYEIYAQCPEIVPDVCPRWRRYYSLEESWSLAELGEAFKRLSQEQLQKRKFCFFIDGVDEYEGDDYEHIIRVLTDLATSPSIKCCVSSRPWNLFITAFGIDPSQRLLLEDHNHVDIQGYIETRFAKDKYFISMQSREPESRELIEQISKNAQGVFLWVKLVVNNLLRGIKNDDSLKDLHRRLQQIPTSLTAYFQHMLSTIDEFYREETAEMLLICLQGLQPLPLLVYWFYEQDRKASDYALQAKVLSFKESDHKTIRKRLNARGQGLLEVGVNPSNSWHLTHSVQFSHRTVKDFITEPRMLERLNSWVSSGFDAMETLQKATLAILKSIPASVFDPVPWQLRGDIRPSMERENIHNKWWRHVSDFFYYAHVSEAAGGAFDPRLFEELQYFVATQLLADHRRFGKLDNDPGLLARGCNYFLPFVDSRWRPEAIRECPPLPLQDPEMAIFFFTLAVEANLIRYMEYKLASNPRLINRSDQQRPFLDRALRPMPWPTASSSINYQTVALLLSKGADPNEYLWTFGPILETNYTYGSLSTVWGCFLECLDLTAQKDGRTPRIIQNQFEASKLMIQHGALADLRPWKSVVLRVPFRGPNLAPSYYFHKAFSPVEARFLQGLMKQHQWGMFSRFFMAFKRTLLLWLARGIFLPLWLLTKLPPFWDVGLILGMAMIGWSIILFGILLLLSLLLLPYTIRFIGWLAPVLLRIFIFFTLCDWCPPLERVVVWSCRLLVKVLICLQGLVRTVFWFCRDLVKVLV